MLYHLVHMLIVYKYNFIDNDPVTPIEWVETIKDLGILTDEKVSLKEHIHDKINKPYAMLGLIKQNFTHLTTSSFILLYKNLARSHVEHCNSVWCPQKRIVNVWNCLSSFVVSVDSVNCLKIDLTTFGRTRILSMIIKQMFTEPEPKWSGILVAL